MKIGLYLGGISPTDGGGYTLLTDQVSALSRLQRASEHEIILLHQTVGSSFVAQFSEFPSINLDAERLGVRTQSELDDLLREQQRVFEADQQRILEEERQRVLEADQQRILEEERARVEARVRQQNDEFDRRCQQIARFSDLASRVYAALYGPYSRLAPLNPPVVRNLIPQPCTLTPTLSEPPSILEEPITGGSGPSKTSEPSKPHESTEPTEPSWPTSIYIREGIQFIIYLAPWFGAIEMDIPFALVVWDLQHRISPWFPEVSAGQEWNRREKNYAELLRRAALIYTGTEQGKAEVVAYYQVPPERIRVLPFLTPHFVLDSVSKPRDADRLSKFGLPADYLFYPAQFWAHKNHVLLLEACKIVRNETGWDIGVVFTGAEKGNQKYVREYAGRLGLENQVKFLGFVEKADILELYRGAVCLAFPTFFGPDNLPPLEAFALGCPVIASDIPGAQEQLGDAAVLVSPTNERAWAEAILGLRNEEMRTQIIDAGLAVAAKDGWDDYGRRLLDSVNEFAAIRRSWS
jgi:glycosyltransferase involved in cell wall biosynthesis